MLSFFAHATISGFKPFVRPEVESRLDVQKNKVDRLVRDLERIGRGQVVKS